MMALQDQDPLIFSGTIQVLDERQDARRRGLKHLEGM
jgi:hypothetical protein